MGTVLSNARPQLTAQPLETRIGIGTAVPLHGEANRRDREGWPEISELGGVGKYLRSHPGKCGQSPATAHERWNQRELVEPYCNVPVELGNAQD